MRKRAWWLLILGVIFPGTAQLIGGNRKLGRFALRFTLANVALLLLALAIFLINKNWLIGLATVPFLTTVLGWYLWFFGALFALLMLDALSPFGLAMENKGAADENCKKNGTGEF